MSIMFIQCLIVIKIAMITSEHFLEIIFIILNSFYLYRVLKRISFSYSELEVQYLDKQSDEMKQNVLLFRVFGFDKISLIDKSFAAGLSSLLYRLLVTTIRSLP